MPVNDAGLERFMTQTTRALEQLAKVTGTNIALPNSSGIIVREKVTTDTGEGE